MNEVTIIIPYFNRAQLLERTLHSIARCTWRTLHLILVDNNSTDHSRQVCEQFAETHRSPQFDIVLTEEPQKGAAAARNRGLALCQTPFVYFFDCDDEFDPDFLPTIMPLLTNDIDLLAVTTRQVVKGRTEVRAFRPTDSPVAQVLVSHLATQSMVIRTDFLRHAGGWNASLHIWNDWELGLRLLMARPRMRWFTSTPFHYIFKHDDSLTGPNWSARIDVIRVTMQTVLQNYPQLSAALRLRWEILTGQLLREHNREEAENNKKLTHTQFACESVWIRMLGNFLRFYTSIGGRGAWRIAYGLCPAPKQTEQHHA
ncbi:MAG: glycosyltransferase family 2 protein [Prevotellaceae bacterium]|nr:glycosyltransferase family 2 protein [Prevotellaceae bacterium]